MLGSCASLQVVPARVQPVKAVDYFRQPDLPDKPPAPTIFAVKLKEDAAPEVTAGPSLSPWEPGEATGHRPHRPVLRVAFTSPDNLAHAGQAFGSLYLSLFDCDTEASLDSLRLTPLLWRGHKLPDADAARAIAHRTPPATYYFYVNTSLRPDPEHAGQITPVDLRKTPENLCFQVIARNRFGDRLRTITMEVPKQQVEEALQSCRRRHCAAPNG